MGELALRKEEKSLGILCLKLLSKSEIFRCVMFFVTHVSNTSGVSSVLECAFELAMSVWEELQE